MKIKNLFAIAALLMGSMSASAQTASGIFKITVDGAGKATITGFKADCPASDQVDVEIPGTLVNEGGDDFPVIGIDDDAFKSNANLKSISIAKSVKTIGSSVFEDCSQLATVTFEEGSQLEAIGANAFGDTPSLTAISFANCAKMKDFSPAAPFVNASNVNYQLKTITFSAATINIGTALAGLKALTTVNLGETSINGLADGSLANTDALTTLTLPETCLTIGATGKTGLTSLTINATGNATTALTMGATSFTMSATANSTVTFGNIVNQAITADAIVGNDSKTIDLTIGNILCNMTDRLISGKVGAVVVGNIGNATTSATVNTAVFGAATSISFGAIIKGGLVGTNNVAAVTSLTSVTFTGDVALEGIGAYAFAKYTNLASVDFQGTLAKDDADTKFVVLANAFCGTDDATNKIYAGSAAEAALDGTRLTVSYLPADEAIYGKIIDANAFADAAYGGADDVKFTTTRKQGLLMAAIKRVIPDYAAEEVEITVAKKDGKYWYGTHFNAAPLKIAKEQNGDKVMVYGAYVDQSDNTIYMDQLHVIGGFYYVPANVPVVVKSNTAEKVKAVGLAATDAAYVKFGSMNLKDATHWQNEICVNNVAGRNTGAKVQNATADKDWTINPDGAAANVDNNGFAIFFLYPAATYNFYWNSITASAKAPADAFYLRMNKALINAGARVNVVWLDGSEEATAIQTVKKANAEKGAIYNLAGQKVNASYKGVVIKDGKKYIQK